MPALLPQFVARHDLRAWGAVLGLGLDLDDPMAASVDWSSADRLARMVTGTPAVRSAS